MRRKLNQCLQTDDHEICLAGFSLMTIILSGKIFLGNAQFSDTCSLDNSVDGLYTLNCSLLNPTNLYTTAHAGDDGSKSVLNVEVIYAVPINNRYEIALDLLGIPFSRYPLKRVIIRRNRIIKIISGNYNYENHYLIFYKSHVSQMFEDCTYLEYLEVSSSHFTDPVQFRLPRNLKTFNISKNEYRALQIQGSEALEELNANNNPLLTVPTLFDDLEPPLTTLRLKGCPLQDMTIVDLARFCFLQFLELDFPPENRLLQPEAYCNCTIFHQWAKEVSFQIQTLNCYQPKSDEKIACSSTSYFEDARKIRKKCPLLKRGALSKTLFTIMKYVFFFLIFLLLLGTIILYIIRHYHLREWWREHHLRVSKATSRKMEEEEEASLQESASSSEGSIPSKTTLVVPI